jgi:nucleoid-associated protein YgaU
MVNGYNFYFKLDTEVLTLPITPGELTIKSGSNNKVVNLINEGDINILKSPSLTEISFEARFPMRQYPYGRSFKNFQSYFDVFKELKTEKKPFTFVVSRFTPNGVATWGTEYLVSLEELEIKENASEGDDVLITFKLKQYKEYSVVILERNTTSSSSGGSSTTSTSTNRTSTSSNTVKKYTVKKGDCLWNISKKFYGTGTKWKKIYNANKAAIEKDAKRHGRRSSSNGHWIYPGLVLTIPKK